MKLQNLLNRLEKLHPKEIDLSLERIKKLCKNASFPNKEYTGSISLELILLITFFNLTSDIIINNATC